MQRKKSVFLSLFLVLMLMVCPFLIVRSYGDFSEAVTNGGFESGLSGWSFNYGTAEIVTLNPHAGTYCAQDSLDDSMTGWSMHQEFASAIPSEHAGYLSFWVNSTGSVYIYVLLRYQGAGWVDYYLADPYDWATWTVINSTLANNYPGDYITEIQITVNCNGGSNYIWLDDVSVTYDTGESVTPAPLDVLSPSLMNWFLYMFVLLAPAFILGVFMKMGKWGFMIGLGVGAGLGYGFISGFPLWLLMVVVLGEIGMAYQAVTSGG